MLIMLDGSVLDSGNICVLEVNFWRSISVGLRYIYCFQTRTEVMRKLVKLGSGMADIGWLSWDQDE
jgi:hypothetical protein